MILFPNCKINLGLSILDKRPDGYHRIESVMYPVLIRDAAEVLPFSPYGKESRNLACEFTASGIPIPGPSSGNLCLKAWELLKKDFPDLPAVRMHLHKSIPIGAGLGGGSSDGAIMLLMLNQQFNLNLTANQLMDYAGRLGSDCPFFILNKPCFATGRGEQLQPIVLDLSAYSIVLVDPRIHISTAWAFSQVKPSEKKISVKTIIAKPVETWKNRLINDFEEPIFNVHPELAEIKQQMYAAGAIYAAMTGSGATIAGIFPSKPEGLPGLANHYRVMIL